MQWISVYKYLYKLFTHACWAEKVFTKPSPRHFMVWEGKDTESENVGNTAGKLQHNSSRKPREDWAPACLWAECCRERETESLSKLCCLLEVQIPEPALDQLHENLQERGPGSLCFNMFSRDSYAYPNLRSIGLHLVNFWPQHISCFCKSTFSLSFCFLTIAQIFPILKKKGKQGR